MTQLLNRPIHLVSMLNRPLRLGHRGARAVKSVPENTLASFELCLAHGCDGFEFDVRVSSDGVPVVCHNAVFRRKRIRKYPAGELKLPTLRDVLAQFHKRAFLDIELKVAGTEEQLLKLFAQYPPARGFVVSSFLPDVLQRVRALSPSIPLGLICDTKKQRSRWSPALTGHIILHHRLATKKAVANLTSKGARIIVWTVNRKPAMRRYLALSVAGIISDKTALLGSL